MTKDTHTRRLLNMKTGASYLSLSYWTLRAMILNGEIPFIRAGRRILIDRQDLDHWIEERKERFS